MTRLLDIASFNRKAQHVHITIDDDVLCILNQIHQPSSEACIPSESGWGAVLPKCIAATSPDALDYLGLVIAIDYRHWGYDVLPAVGMTVKHKEFYYKKDKQHRGSMAMMYMLKDAVDVHDIHWYKPEFILQEANDAVFNSIFLGVDSCGNEMHIPDLDYRLQLMKEICSKLQDSRTSFASQAAESRGDIDSFLHILRELHIRYIDDGVFGTQPSTDICVHFMKLAKLTVSAFMSVQPMLFKESAALTICPDYQISRALREMGVLQYSQSLSSKIDNRVLLEVSSQEEVEIRLGAIIAAEDIKRRMGWGTSDIDYALWSYGRSSCKLPHHYCMTRMY